jgi:hypothetical protein
LHRIYSTDLRSFLEVLIFSYLTPFIPLSFIVTKERGKNNKGRLRLPKTLLVVPLRP